MAGFLSLMKMALVLLALVQCCGGKLVVPQERACAPAAYVTVTGHAYIVLVPGVPIPYAKLRLVERNVKITADYKGDFKITDACVGDQITVEMGVTPGGVDNTRSATIVVKGPMLNPKEGIILQAVPTVGWPFVLAATTLAGAPWNKANSCYFIVTVTAKGKHYDVAPQGIAGAVLTITHSPAFTGKKLYADVMLGKVTQPFSFKRTNTSVDGGVFIPNLPVSNTPYTVTASLNGYTFSPTLMYCTTPGFIVNAGPFNGPTVQ